MRKYHGVIVHRSKDPYGPLEIVEDGLVRSLHFGNAVRQSATDLQRPAYPVLAYTRAMLGGLLFQPAPRRALLIGLGGGSLAKFLLHHFPECAVEAVEQRAHVVKLAHGWFLLPETPRLHIHVADGDAFVRQAAENGDPAYDLILVDAYDGAGMADAMAQTPFLAACRRLLSPDGVLVCNLWGNDRPRSVEVRRRLQQCFGAVPWLLTAEGTTNLITLSLRRPGGKVAKAAAARAKVLEARTGMDFVRLSHALRRRRPALLDLLLAY
jgi:spermidine synthase